MLKMRSPSTVIPTVYRVGGTTLIPPPTVAEVIPPVIVESTGIAIATEPLPEKLDASVSAETTKPETNDAAVSTTAVNVESTSDLEKSTILPALPTPPPHVPGSFFLEPQNLFTELLGKCSDPNASYEASAPQEMVQTTAEVPSMIRTFLDRFPPVQGSGLRATFVSDNNVEDGQAFPAGAEFVKSWRMQNDGDVAWPDSTEVVFVAGDRLPAFELAPDRYFVGRVEPGAYVDVYAADMKAPEIPGKYVGYWRLTDGIKFFGQSVWCE